MSVKSRENKALLWQLLSDHPFQKTNPKKFQAVFEYRINEVHNKRFNYKNNLMEMNKEVIRQFASEIANKSNNNDIQKRQLKEQVNSNDENKNNTSFTQLPEPQDSKDYSKINIFEQRLKAQQDNFNALIHKNKPKEIDFSDKAEDVPIDSRIVDDTLQKREAELKKIMNQYNTNGESRKWLESKSTSKRLEKEDSQQSSTANSLNIAQTNNTQNPKHLMIDKQSQNIKIEPDFVFTPINKSVHKKGKKVRFHIDENENNKSSASSASSILNKLKKVTNTSEDKNTVLLKNIQHDIKNLIAKQDIIISIITSLQKNNSETSKD